MSSLKMNALEEDIMIPQILKEVLHLLWSKQKYIGESGKEIINSATKEAWW